MNAQAPLIDILDTHFPIVASGKKLNTLFAHYAKTKIEQVSDYDDTVFTWRRSTIAQK